VVEVRGVFCDPGFSDFRDEEDAVKPFEHRVTTLDWIWILGISDESNA